MEMPNLYVALFVFLGIYAVSALIYVMFRQYMKIKEMQIKVEHARMDDFRAHLERQIVELNQRFASSEERWREVNHLVVAGQNTSLDPQRPLSLPPQSDFLSSHGVDLVNLRIKNKLIFVLTPFHDDFAKEFQTIARVGRDLGFEVARGDEKVHTGEIFPHLLRLIAEARVVIANISGRNPNVFYELGIAHAMDKAVILIAHSRSDIPFDIRSKRIIFFETDSDLERELERMLARTLAEREV